MKNNLKNLGLFSAYVSNEVLEGQHKTNGALTIVSDTENELKLYIDNEFIASGFGFPDESAYTAAFAYISNLGNQIDNLTEILNENIGKIIKNTSVEYTYTDYTNNIFGQKYNNYGMPYSYNYLTFTYIDNNVVSYTLSSTKKTNHNFVKNIDLNLSGNKTYYISENIGIDLKIIFNNDQPTGLEDYKLSCIYGNSNDDKIEVNLSDLSRAVDINNDNYNIQTIEVETPNEVKKQDVTIKLFNKYNSNTDNYYEIYSYVYKDFLSWKNKILYSNNYDINYNGELISIDYDKINEVNLNNNMQETVEDSNLKNNFINIINSFTDINTYYSYDEEIELTFNNVKALYDYIFIDEDVNVDFYLNEIKSNQWVRKIIEIVSTGSTPNKTYYIYQSPQKYIGEHTWIIKIHKK